MKYKELIERLKEEQASMKMPGPVLDGIMYEYLEKFSEKYEHDHELLLIGACLGDIRIDKSKELGDLKKHVPLALEYAKELYEEYEMSKEEQKIVDEVIATHHGGEQKYIESKIFKNADNFKFLDPKGCLHFFGALYTDHTEEGLKKNIAYSIEKQEEKMKLTDLDDETIELAKSLFNRNLEFLQSI